MEIGSCWFSVDSKTFKISVEKIKGNVVGKGSRLFFLDQVWRLVEGAESCRDETGLKAYRKVWM